MPVLHETILGPTAFATLPAAVRAFHLAGGTTAWRGEAEVTGGNGSAAYLIRWLMGLPALSPRVTAEVRADVTPGGMVWRRTFAGRLFQSTLSADGSPGILRERVGMMTFRIRLTPTAAGLAYPLIGWSVFGVPLPMALGPRSDTLETVDEEGRYAFDIQLSMPAIGPLVRYRGWLVADHATRT